jgi:hypothetical protein
MPDGSIPYLQMNAWGCWVIDCIALLDSDGTYRHWKYEGAYADQPWLDLQVYGVIRQRWVELRNEEMDTKFNRMSTGFKGSPIKGKRPRMGHRRR